MAADHVPVENPAPLQKYRAFPAKVRAFPFDALQQFAGLTVVRATGPEQPEPTANPLRVEV
jgi:hypothetical protein